MIPSSPNTIGTNTFRPVSVGYSRRLSVADGFRPVVAGQYLRTDQFIGPSEFTFLEPSGLSAAEYRYSVNVSPRMIWQVFHSSTVRNPSAIERPFAETAFANADIPLEQHVHHSVPHGPSGTSATGRFLSLSELATWVVSTVRKSATQGSTGRSTHQLSLLSHPYDGGRPFIPESPDQGRMPTEGRNHEFGPLSLQYYGGRSFVPGFTEPNEPSLMKYNSRPPHADDRVQTVRAVRHSGLPQQYDRTYYNATWHVKGTAPHLPIASFLISPAPRKAAEEVYQKPAVRTEVTRRSSFGGISAVGVHRPAQLIPAIFRTLQSNKPEHESDGTNLACPPGGASAAEVFAISVTTRHVRSETSPTSSSFVAAVPLVVRESPQASVSAKKSQSMDFSIPSSPERSNAVPAVPGLPPGLMQQLTEEVVRALDSRTLAASERAGRF